MQKSFLCSVCIENIRAQHVTGSSWTLSGRAPGMPDCHCYGQIWMVTGKIAFTQKFTSSNYAWNPPSIEDSHFFFSQLIRIDFSDPSPPTFITYLLLEKLTVQKKMKTLLGARSSLLMCHSYWKPSEFWRINWGETEKLVLNLSWTKVIILKLLGCDMRMLIVTNILLFLHPLQDWDLHSCLIHFNIE